MTHRRRRRAARRAAPAVAIERAGRHRSADRHPLEQAGRRTLPAPWPTKSCETSWGDPSVVREAGRDAGALDEPDERERHRRARCSDGDVARAPAASGSGSDSGHLGDVADLDDVGVDRAGTAQPSAEPTNTRDDQAERPEAGALEERRSARSVVTPTTSVGTSIFPKFNSEVERPKDPVGALRLVAREVVELAEHDVDADGGDEPGHHRVRHEPQERAQPQECRRRSSPRR